MELQQNVMLIWDHVHWKPLHPGPTAGTNYLRSLNQFISKQKCTKFSLQFSVHLTSKILTINYYTTYSKG